MNTVLKGNQFEEKAFKLIIDKVNNGNIPILPQCCKFQRKPKYYSKNREANIEFDISIEITPKGATNYQLLYLIECKDYSSKVSVDNIEEFTSKISQVAGENVKGVFIFTSELQSGAYTFAKNKGLMLIKVLKDDRTDILLHNAKNSMQNDSPLPWSEKVKDILGERNTGSHLNNDATWDDVIHTIITNALNTENAFVSLESSWTKIERLSKEHIEKFSQNILMEIDPLIVNGQQKLQESDLISHIKKTYNIEIEYDPTINALFASDIKGYCNPKKRIIYLNETIIETANHLFTLVHEFGHILLHTDTGLKQKDYDDMKGSKFNSDTNQHELTNNKDWIEWQANQFAACLLMPKDAVLLRLMMWQLSNGISKPGKVFLDNQLCNKADYVSMITSLSQFFNVSKAMMKYRMESLGLIRYCKNNPIDWRNIMNPDNEAEFVKVIIERMMRRY